jgi:hypothetical protein
VWAPLEAAKTIQMATYNEHANLNAYTRASSVFSASIAAQEDSGLLNDKDEDFP